MGKTVEHLKQEMSEREFYLHCLQMDYDPDPEERSAYYAQALAVLMNVISGTGLLFKEPIFKDNVICPWGKNANRNRSTPSDIEWPRD